MTCRAGRRSTFGRYSNRYANSNLEDRTLFGSDEPALMADQWLKDAEATSFEDELCPMNLKEDAFHLHGRTRQVRAISCNDAYLRIAGCEKATGDRNDPPCAA